MKADEDRLARLLDDLQTIGVELLPDGDRIRYRPRNRVDSQLENRLARHKPELIKRLSTAVTLPPATTWSRRFAMMLAKVADDRLRILFRDLFEERAAICEHDGGLDLESAERLAFEEVEKGVYNYQYSRYNSDDGQKGNQTR